MSFGNHSPPSQGGAQGVGLYWFFFANNLKKIVMDAGYFREVVV